MELSLDSQEILRAVRKNCEHNKNTKRSLFHLASASAVPTELVGTIIKRAPHIKN